LVQVAQRVLPETLMTMVDLMVATAAIQHLVRFFLLLVVGVVLVEELPLAATQQVVRAVVY
jgi:hypothetical protein